jgi:hypothetical protein
MGIFPPFAATKSFWDGNEIIKNYKKDEKYVYCLQCQVFW